MLLDRLLERDVVTIRPEASVLEAARLMRAEHVGCVVVTDADRAPVGIVTDRDIVVSVLATDPEHLGMLAVKEVLSADLVVAREDEDPETVLVRMRRAGVRRVPVVNGTGAVVGIFSVDDLLERLVDDLRAVVSLLSGQRRREAGIRP